MGWRGRGLQRGQRAEEAAAWPDLRHHQHHPAPPSSPPSAEELPGWLSGRVIIGTFALCCQFLRNQAIGQTQRDGVVSAHTTFNIKQAERRANGVCVALWSTTTWSGVYTSSSREQTMQVIYGRSVVLHVRAAIMSVERFTQLHSN